MQAVDSNRLHSTCLAVIMFAYMIIYGTALPDSWLEEETVVIVFFQGEFEIDAFSDILIDAAKCEPYIFRVKPDSALRTWHFTGSVSSSVVYRPFSCFRMSCVRTSRKNCSW